jgi:hypothetical protein
LKSGPPYPGKEIDSKTRKACTDESGPFKEGFIMKKWLLSALGALATVALVATTAPGLDLNAEGGLSLLEGTAHDGYSTASPMVGVSALVGITPFTEIGPFYEYNLVSDSGNTGHQQFFGGMLRFSLLPLLFLDAQVGVSSINNGAGVTSDNALSFGGKLGYQLAFSGVSLSPYIGYRYLPTKFGSTSVDGNTIDFGLMLTLGF